MRKGIIIALLFISVHCQSQSVFGYWYGSANVKTNASASNYMMELILQPAKGHVKGIINYYFKNTYRSLEVAGNYDAANRQLRLYDIPLTYYGSFAALEVDCIMDLQATLRVAQAGSTLQGTFVGLKDYQYTCPDIIFNLKLDAGISKIDSVLKDMQEFKENYQVWKPSTDDTLVAVNVIPHDITNYVTDKEFTKRKNEVQQEIEVESDSLRVDIYDNGEIDGDIISLYYNQKLILSNQKLTHRSIKINLQLDSTKEVNEVSLFAENLGLIPPNTALMVITDGENRYQVSVSSNLEKNATINIRRKKKVPKN